MDQYNKDYYEVHPEPETYTGKKQSWKQQYKRLMDQYGFLEQQFGRAKGLLIMWPEWLKKERGFTDEDVKAFVDWYEEIEGGSKDV